jgi:hypothetical protein
MLPFPLWEKVARMQCATDEGLSPRATVRVEKDPSPMCALG